VDARSERGVRCSLGSFVLYYALQQAGACVARSDFRCGGPNAPGTG
jgi:hypothetical protein